MKKALSTVIALAAVLVIGSTSAMAEEGMFGPFKVGVQGSMGDDSDFGVGVRGEYSLEEMVGMPLSAVASFDYFFPDCPSGLDCTWFEVNVNALYNLPMDMITPYAGAGLNYASVEVDSDFGGSASDSEIGLNVLGGAKFDLGMGFTPFAEFRLEISGGEQWVITAGVLF